MEGDPIEGQVLLIAAAKASVPTTRLPDLVDLVQTTLGPELDRYRREYECVHDTEDFAVFLVESNHWTEIGDQLGLHRREVSAVRRAHEEQLLRIGRRENREEEFETALEIRDAVVIGCEP